MESSSKNNSRIAVIPARSGSKGVPNKNLEKVWGHSLLGLAILVCKKTQLFDRIVVSTDSEEYAMEARKYGAEIPFLRPAELASDSAKISDVIDHLISFYDSEKQKFDSLCLVEPTSPLRTPEMIKDCWSRFCENPAIHLALTVSLVPAHFHPAKQFFLEESGELLSVLNNASGDSPRQLLSSTFIRNGACYWLNLDSFRKIKKIWSEPMCALEIKSPLINIDSLPELNELKTRANALQPKWLKTEE